MLGISWEPCFVWAETQLWSGLAVSHCLMVPEGPRLRLMFCEHVYVPLENSNTQLGARSASWQTTRLPLFNFCVSISPKPIHSAHNKYLFEHTFSPFILQEHSFKLAYSMQTVQCDYLMAQYIDFCHSHAPVEPLPRSRYRTFPRPRRLPYASSQTPPCSGVSAITLRHYRGLSGMCSCVFGFSYLCNL